ncbi:ABC transporter substrate-binding protein [Schaalia naturae]|jgi:multiple sugar transport system substrate-binding protein|uniref:ABC transporter substrate-binding protein n=1 Tax=Schaalia naturae TaxID=635203 RepID=A0ABW2SMC9_9ACTO
MRSIGKRALSGVVALSAVVALAACSNGGGAASGESAGSAGEATSPAYDENTDYDITVWAWEPTIQQDSDVVKAFEEKYPNIHVTVTNVGGAADTYTALSNALQAGSGLPDAAQIEYYALPQYATGSSLADLTEFGAGDLEGQYTPGTWNSINQTTAKGVSGIFGLPVDSGPMALFYNQATFEKAGISEPPTTWDAFYEDAKKIHALGDNYYITSDSGNDAGFLTSIMWQLSPSAFQVDGQNITVDFTDPNFQKFVDIWQKLIDEDLISTSIVGWSDEWFKGLGDGTLASLPTGAWMPANLLANSSEASGDFRVAPMPSIDGSAVNAENGGSSLAIMDASGNKAAAYKFLEFVSNGDGATLRVKGGNFPSLQSTLDDTDFQESTGDFANQELLDYFGGQTYNSVLAEGASAVNTGWTYLPYEVAANSKFGDTVGQAYNGSGTKLTDALAQWAQAIEDYGNEQGYSVTVK